MLYSALSSHLFWTSDLWKYQPGSHRRKVSQDFSRDYNKNRRFGLSRVDMRYFQHAHFIPIVGVGKRGEY